MGLDSGQTLFLDFVLMDFPIAPFIIFIVFFAAFIVFFAPLIAFTVFIVCIVLSALGIRAAIQLYEKLQDDLRKKELAAARREVTA